MHLTGHIIDVWHSMYDSLFGILVFYLADLFLTFYLVFIWLSDSMFHVLTFSLPFYWSFYLTCTAWHFA